MARGGSREGAGRPKGQRNVRTAEQAAAIEASGLTPLDYLMSVVRDIAAAKDERIDAAKAAAPYVHPKLSSIEHRGDSDNPLEVITRIELVDGDGED